MHLWRTTINAIILKAVHALRGGSSLQHANLQRAGIAFVLGALSVSAFAPYHILPAIIIAFTGLVWLIDASLRARNAALLGFSFGFGQFLTGLFWIAEAFSAREGFTYTQGIASVVMLATALALFPAIVLATVQTIIHRRAVKGVARVVLFAVMWSLGEWLRGHIFTGFPWNMNAASVASVPALAQSAAFIGVYGLSFLITLIAAMPAAILDEKQGYHPRVWVTVFLLPTLLLTAGLWRLHLHPTRLRDDITLVLVQPGIEQKDKWQREKLLEHFRTYMDLSSTALQAVSTPRVVVIWPETAIAYPVDEQEGTRFLISKILDRHGYVITGAPRFMRQGNGQFDAWNSVFAIDRFGNIAAQYDKSHLVPFGEYVPLRPLLSHLGVERMVEGLADFQSGSGPMTLNIEDIPAFSPLICYEAIFSGAVVANEGPRPGWLLNLSNDAWFGQSAGPHQHYALARLRAIEEGLPLIRSTPTGISVSVDPVGREITRLESGKKGVVITSLPFELKGRTVFSILVDLPYFLLISIVFIIGFIQKLW